MFEHILEESSQDETNIGANVTSFGAVALRNGTAIGFGASRKTASVNHQPGLENFKSTPPQSEEDYVKGVEFENLDLPSSLNVIREQSAGYETAKRCFDVIVSAALLLALFPLLLVISICVIVTSPGPVLFKQPRLGRGGKKFNCYKFRSMVHNAETLLQSSPELASQYLEQGFKIKDDPRVTKIGAFMRKTSIDELPQLINVFMGEMSMIGPRPIVPKEIACYGQFAEKLLTVVPGLSGMWQACGRSETSYCERVELDMIYVDQRSLALDLKLAIRTVTSVVKGTGAY